MKVIYPDLTIAAEADGEDANYPASNLADEHPKDLWKGTGNSHVVKITAGAGSNAITVFNTNAASISVAVKLGESAEWATGTEWAGGAEWYSSEETPSGTYDLDPAGVGSFWAEYTAIDAPHIIELTMTAAAGTVLQAGVARAGTVNTFRDPSYGIKEGLKDYSVVKILNNGALLIVDRDIVSTFNLRLNLLSDTDFYMFMRSIMKQNGSHPLPWRIVHNKLTNAEWIVYASCLQMPEGEHVYLTNKPLIIPLTEVV